MSYTKIHNQPKGVKKNQNEPKRTKSIQKRQNKKKLKRDIAAHKLQQRLATITQPQPGRSVQSYD